MPVYNSFIIIKGEPKALQIEKITLGANGVYDVKFDNSPTTFHYRRRDVVVLNDGIWHDPVHCRVYIHGREHTEMRDIRSFQYMERLFWRITYSSGMVQDYTDEMICVEESCLKDEQARSAFEYLKNAAYVNTLGRDEEHGAFLPSLYENLDFIDENGCAACYLNPAVNRVKERKVSGLIFPFGCNASQERAVTAAFENQISVVQGPPGTGKTQTILNIIANIIMQDKTVLVVSNNNSATTNVLEKLEKYGLGFIVAPLGKKSNKESFVDNQPAIPTELSTWGINGVDLLKAKKELSGTIKKLNKVYSLQEELALSKQELKDITLEFEHYKNEYHIHDNTYVAKSGVSAKRFLSLWLHYQAYAENDVIAPQGFFARLMESIKWKWMNFRREHILGVKSPLNRDNLIPTILELQALYYTVRIKELNKRIEEIDSELKTTDAKTLSSSLTSLSLTVFKDKLCSKYKDKVRTIFRNVREVSIMGNVVLENYPVILSTTFSARTTLQDTTYDYLIMDEASQVSIETGALAMTCAKNAVIVGDTLQLPNVVTQEDKEKLDTIFRKYNVTEGYDTAKYSFLESVCRVLPNVKQTLLREHYRCHPRIINFCNQKFYGGRLLIMTEDRDEENVMSAIKTVPGMHRRGKINQREIDVVKQELLPTFDNYEEVGIITPYNAQVDEFRHEIPEIETATVHKYQGREKDTIIMSTVDDQISEFSDDPNLLNVAISRAKKQFCIVLSGNEQERKGNISELIDYISYNNFSVVESKVHSVFDYLYSQYTEQRISYLQNTRRISEFDSENLTYKLVLDIISENVKFNHIGVLCHVPIRSFINDWKLMNEEERKYVSHYSTHLDFLLVNHVTKMPILAIETDGYSYHNVNTDQHRRDLMKDSIMKKYELPLLRLSTVGSGEKEKITDALNGAIGDGC